MLCPSHVVKIQITVAAYCSLGLVATCTLFAQQPVGNLVAARAAMAAGLNAMQQGDLAQAKLDFERVVKLAAQIEPGHAALGSVLLAQSDYDPAERELENAHRLDPQDLAVDLNLGRALTALGRYKEAIDSFRNCLDAPNPLTLSLDETLAYAVALSATGQQTSALHLLQHAVVATPESAPLNDGLGTLLAQSGRFDDALPYFKHAVEIDAKMPLAQLHLASALLELNRPDNAIAPAESAAAALPNSFQAQLQLGRALSALHRDTEALAHLHRAAELRAPGQSADALYALALALQASGDAKGSLPIFAEALGVDAGKNQGSLNQSSFNRGSALTNYALARVQTGDAAGALPLYQQALAAGPDSVTLREDFGASYLQMAEIDHAIEQFNAGLAIEPDNAHLHYDLGLAYKLKDNLDAAVPEFERSAARDPTLPDPAYTLGVIYMQQAHYPEAILNLERVTALEPANGDAWALLGTVLKDSGDAPAAVDAIQHAIQLQPDLPNLHIQLAALVAQQGQTAQAAAERKIAADLSKAVLNNQRAQFALRSGRALLEQNKLEDAVFQLNAALKADPALTEAHTLLAEAFDRQGKSAEAALERKQANNYGSTTTAP
jgi:tetratricopeptide (TPR) repeat protein